MSVPRLVVASVLLATVLAARPAQGGQSDGERYARALIDRAHALGLAHTRQWHRLGHWQKIETSSGWPATRPVQRWESQVDGLDFFLAHDGKRSPEAELEATLRGFLTSREEGDAHPLCRYPARLAWLSRVLAIDARRLPSPDCTGFREFVDTLRPRAAVLVFSSYYINKAASAFGHTFLRIEKDEPYAVAEKRKLLDTGIDYSATVTTGNSLLYVLKGLTGGFEGGFRKLPYYYKVREYNDYESRDLWEYRLALTPPQLAMLVAHLWEMGETHFDYFYLTENCSYHILGVLEVARPDVDLLAQIKLPVIPADTVRAVTEVPGLVADVEFRPSLMTQFQLRARTLDDDQLSVVEALVEDAETSLPAGMTERERIRVLDAAADLVDVRWPDDVLFRPESHAARTKLRILARRAEIALPSDPLDADPPWRKQPQIGHRSRRIGLSGGVADDDGPFIGMSYRVALHDLIDPSDGYPELSAIEFLPIDARVYLDELEEPKFRLENASLVRITHLNSQGRFNRKMSWRVDVGGERLRDAGCTDCFAAKAMAGGGVARAFWNDAVALYGTVDSHVRWHPRLDGIGSSELRVGIGPAAGARMRITPRLLSLVTADWIWLPAQDPLAMWSVRGALRYAPWRRVALGIDGGVRDDRFDAQLGAMFYY